MFRTGDALRGQGDWLRRRRVRKPACAAACGDMKAAEHQRLLVRICVTSSDCRSDVRRSVQVTESRDAEGLRIFYYLVQDLKTMAISIMNAHFRINPYSVQ